MADNLVEIHLQLVHAIPGFTSLRQSRTSLLCDPNATVLLVDDADEAAVIHVDRTMALIHLCDRGFANRKEEEIASALEQARHKRKQQKLSTAWLVTDVFIKCDILPVGYYSQQMPQFSVAVDALPQELRDDLLRLASSALGRVTAALAIRLGSTRFKRVHRAGVAYYWRTPGTEKLQYELHLHVGSPEIELTCAADHALIQSVIDEIQALPKLGIETALRLYKDALEDTDNPLRSFIIAWAALETFVKRVFASHYTPEFVPRSEQVEVNNMADQLGRINKSKYTLEQQFLFLALWLDPDNAKMDADAFAALNVQRNELYHQALVGNTPADNVENLFRRYLGLLADNLRRAPG